MLERAQAGPRTLVAFRSRSKSRRKTSQGGDILRALHAAHLPLLAAALGAEGRGQLPAVAPSALVVVRAVGLHALCGRAAHVKSSLLRN